MNREQEVKIKKLEAQIEALTQRWMMTEENIKARDNMHNLMLRLTATTGHTSGVVNATNLSHNISHNTTTNTALGVMGGTTGNTLKSIHASSSSFVGVSANKRDSSPITSNANVSSTNTHN